jgi:hypothetical protein
MVTVRAQWQRSTRLKISPSAKILTSFRPHCPGFFPLLKWVGGKRMRLKLKHPDDFRSNSFLVLDEDTGKAVGTVRLSVTGVGSSAVDIWLFDGKYQTRVKGHDTAVGFLLGVESVLNHHEDLQFQFASRAA